MYYRCIYQVQRRRLSVNIWWPFRPLRDSSMQGIFRQVEKDDEKAPLTQGLYHEFLSGLIVDLQGSSPTFGMQVTLHGAGVESGGHAVYVKSVLFNGHGAGLWLSIYDID